MPTWMTFLLGLLLAGCAAASPPAATGPPATAPESFSATAIELELPDLGTERHPPGVLRILEPEKIRRLVFHIARPAIHSAFPKINTIGTGLVHVMRARRDEVLYEVDLLRHEGRYYELSGADNTVEIKVVIAKGREPLVARWVIAPPKDLVAWRSHQSTAGLAAEAGASQVEILEELGPGETRELRQGLTAASRVVIRATLLRVEPELSLRVTWRGVEGGAKTRSVGWSDVTAPRRGAGRAPTPGQLAAPVDLSVGKNWIEVEVLHGYTVLSKSTFELLRRAPTDPQAITGEKWAVVVGVSNYRAEGLKLNFAHRDAEALAKVLVERGGFAADRVRLLTDERATHGEVRSALFSFLAATKPEDLVVVFLAGHGVPDPNNSDNFYFLAHDSDLANLGGTALPMWDLDSVMDYTIRSRRIVILADTCHSGAMADRSSAGAESLNFFNKYLEALAREKGRLVITASQAHELSREASEVAHGVFTAVLLSGLGGSADDNPADGVVTAGELLDHLRLRVPEVSNGEQHPSSSHEGFDLNLPLARVGGTRP